jgi:endonuclease I
MNKHKPPVPNRRFFSNKALVSAKKNNFMERRRLFNWTKRVLIIFVAVSLEACSGDDKPAPGKDQPFEVQEPVAKDDSYETGENEDLIISNLMENDMIFDYGRISNFDANSSGEGSVVKNDDGTYTYTPDFNFTGTDVFSYTLCDAELPANCSTGTVEITVTNASPTATEDNYTVDEDKTLNISNHLENDDLADNASVNEITSDSGNATVTLNDDNSISYEPNEGFAGTDSFTYALCDDDGTPNCSTGTITITVTDTGSPQAEDDIVAAEFGAGAVTYSNLVTNDDITDQATLTSVDGSASSGTVTLNSDGSVTYVPAAGFKGEDTFTYSLCDDDVTPTCSTAMVTVKVLEPVAFNIPDDLKAYYADLTITTNSDLNYQFVSEHTIKNHTTILSYGQRHEFLYNADADLSNSDNVILMYTGESRYYEEYTSGSNSYSPQTFNTEHIFPQSKLSNDVAVSDLHHLRSADSDINSLRSNYPYADGSGTYKLIGDNGWFPGDDWKGDVARMVFYLNVRYGEEFAKVGGLDLLLKWNREDPVSDFEIQRNNVIYAAQGDRNIFIDNPYIATLIWGGASSENTWE